MLYLIIVQLISRSCEYEPRVLLVLITDLLFLFLKQGSLEGIVRDLWECLHETACPRESFATDCTTCSTSSRWKMHVPSDGSLGNSITELS